VIAAILAGTTIASLVADYFPGMGSAIGGVLIIVMILFVAVFGLLTFLLLRFAILTRRGLEMRNQSLFNEGLKALRFYFIIYGVIGIIGILINAASLFSL
jgi:hypothetical protein